MKGCSGCRKSYPKNSENFPYKDKAKNYFQPKCRDCQSAYMKNYRKAHREKFLMSNRRYDKTPKGAYKKLKQSIRGHKVSIAQKEFVEWFVSQPKTCFYCGLTEDELQTVKDSYNNKTYRLSIDRLDSSKGYEKGNMVLCCLRCNNIKGDFFTASEMVEIGLKYIRGRWNAQRH